VRLRANSRWTERGILHELICLITVKLRVEPFSLLLSGATQKRIRLSAHTLHHLQSSKVGVLVPLDSPIRGVVEGSLFGQDNLLPGTVDLLFALQHFFPLRTCSSKCKSFVFFGGRDDPSDWFFVRASDFVCLATIALADISFLKSHGVCSR